MDVPPIPPDPLPPVPPVPSVDAGTAGLQFDKADFGHAGTSPICAACQDALAGEYYDINGESFCPPCKTNVEATLRRSPDAVKFFRAVAGGLAGGVAGAVVWALVALSGYRFSLIAIAMGWLIARGIMWGTGGRGGLLYQCLAVVLYYVSMAVAHIPDILRADFEVSGPAYVITVVLTTLIAPVLVAFSSFLSPIILGFGGWEAWRSTRGVPLVITGPLHAAFRPSGAAGGGA